MFFFSFLFMYLSIYFVHTWNKKKSKSRRWSDVGREELFCAGEGGATVRLTNLRSQHSNRVCVGWNITLMLIIWMTIVMAHLSCQHDEIWACSPLSCRLSLEVSLTVGGTLPLAEALGYVKKKPWAENQCSLLSSLDSGGHVIRWLHVLAFLTCPSWWTCEPI